MLTPAIGLLTRCTNSTRARCNSSRCTDVPWWKAEVSKFTINDSHGVIRTQNLGSRRQIQQVKEQL